MKSARFTIALSAVMVLLSAVAASAASVTIAWAPNDDPDLAGYVLKYGEQPRVYTQYLDVGNTTTAKLETLTAGKTYYIAVQAYAADGSVSNLSSEITVTAAGSPRVDVPAAPTASVPAQFAVTVGADGRLTSRQLQWGRVADAQAYYVTVGTTTGGRDILDTGETHENSVALPPLPNGTYVARLFTKQNNAWRFVDLSFMPAKQSAGARLLAPLANAQGVTSAQVFQWESIPQAQSYYLAIGTQAGAQDVLNSGETTRTWWTVPSLPSGRHLYARVWTKIGGNWTYSDSDFVSATKSVLVYPYQAASDTSAYETFVWTGVTDAQSYYLYVGTSPGAKDIVDTGETKSTSFQVNGLEPGKTLYARVYTLIKGQWEVDSVTFTTSLSARFTKPMAGDGSDLGQGIAWTTILGADSYLLNVGSAPGAKDLLDSGEVLRNDYQTPALPAGQQVYARIWTKYAGQWRNRETSVTLAGAALTSPFADATGAATVNQQGELFQWTTISNAEAYYLYVGTQPGGKDIVETGELHMTSYLVKNLPKNTRIYVSVWTKANGVWNGTSSTFVTR
jgi:hypothetical protein